jgi:hypothetical protein
MAPPRTHLEEELEQVNVVWLRAEMLLEEVVNRGLEHERVVDGDVADGGLEIRECEGMTGRTPAQQGSRPKTIQRDFGEGLENFEHSAMEVGEVEEQQMVGQKGGRTAHRVRRQSPTHHLVPARLTAAGNALVHHIVRDEEVRLELGPGEQLQHRTQRTATTDDPSERY